MSGDQDPNSIDEVEQSLRHQMEEEKSNYKETFNDLRTLKTEIEHLQHFLEKSRLQLQKDFELWWAEQAANVQVRKCCAVYLYRSVGPKKGYISV